MAIQSTQFCRSAWLECKKVFTEVIDGELFKITVSDEKKAAEAVYRIFLRTKRSAASAYCQSGDSQPL